MSICILKTPLFNIYRLIVSAPKILLLESNALTAVHCVVLRCFALGGLGFAPFPYAFLALAEPIATPGLGTAAMLLALVVSKNNSLKSIMLPIYLNSDSND
jgi:hypothetical protein